MATYVLIHGAADSAWYWHLVGAELRERGHDVVAVDLPCDDDSAGWEDYAGTVVAAIGERSHLVVVAHSLGGFTAPLVCARVPVDLLVLVAAMVPAPGETGAQWWANTDYEDGEGDAFEAFLHDVPADLAAEAMEHGRDQSATPMAQPWPLEAWPDVPTRFALSRRPLLQSELPAARSPGPTGDRPGRDRRRPHPRPQPAGRTSRAPGDLLERAVMPTRVRLGGGVIERGRPRQAG